MSSQLVHRGDVEPRSGFLRTWERTRNKHGSWFVECLSEFLGVFIYTFAGTGATLAYNIGNIAKLSGVGSLLGIGISYAVGIVLAITICAPVSGAHLSPAVTITFALFRRFPALKAVRYVVAQILGAFVACLVIYVQYHSQIKAVTEVLELQGTLDQVNFSPQGIAGTFALYPPAGSSLGNVFLNEFVCTFILGMVIWACIDPTNFHVPISMISVVIGLGYGMIIWGYAPVGIAANTARDVGGRMMAVAIWGTKASGGAYGAIAALTNILASFVSLVVYEAFFTDSSRVICPTRRVHLDAVAAELERRKGEPSFDEGLGSTEKVRA